MVCCLFFSRAARSNAIYVLIIFKATINKEKYFLMFYFLVCFKTQSVSATTIETIHQFKFYNNFEYYVE